MSIDSPIYDAYSELERLIAFDTVSRNSNLAMIEYTSAVLTDAGAKVWHIPNENMTKANLLATLGPENVAGGIMLSGHTDVVPVDEQPWDTDPFNVTRVDSKVFGRGTSDMKGFIACTLAIARRTDVTQLKRPLHFAFSYDEEVGCTGCLSMVRKLAAELPRPALCIVGEPTDMQVVNAHKGIAAFTTEVFGHEAHSSRTHAGINALTYAARLVAVLEELEAEMKELGDESGRFDPPYTSIHVGTFSAGTALNIIPRHAKFDWEIRALPEQDVEELVARFESAAARIDAKMKAKAQAVRALGENPAADVGVVTRRGAMVPGLSPEPVPDAETLALKLAEQNSVQAVSYGTEAGHFQNAGVPTIVCGPGSINQAHKPNEYIELGQLDEAMGLLERVVQHLSKP